MTLRHTAYYADRSDIGHTRLKQMGKKYKNNSCQSVQNCRREGIAKIFGLHPNANVKKREQEW